MFDEKVCRDIKSIREHIDLVDEEIVKLLAKRNFYVKEAAKFKNKEEEVNDIKRLREIFRSKKALAIKHGVSSTLVVDLYKTMIATSLKEEQNEFKNSKKQANIKKVAKIALVGDYKDEVSAHRCIPKALILASEKTDVKVDFTWIDTRRVNIKNLKKFDGIWCVPSSPYKSMQGVLNAINFARTHNIPFLATCAGYQYTAIEFARNELDYKKAEHEEVNKETSLALISFLDSSSKNKKEDIFLSNTSLLKQIYKKENIKEEYEGSYALNPDYVHIFKDSSMSFVAKNKNKEIKALEIKENRFFIATAYQPERLVLQNKSHCLIEEFVSKAYEYKLAP